MRECVSVCASLSRGLDGGAPARPGGKRSAGRPGQRELGRGREGTRRMCQQPVDTVMGRAALTALVKGLMPFHGTEI